MDFIVKKIEFAYALVVSDTFYTLYSYLVILFYTFCRVSNVFLEEQKPGWWNLTSSTGEPQHHY